MAGSCIINFFCFILFFINNSAVGLAGWDDCDDEEAVQFSFCVLQSSIVT